MKKITILALVIILSTVAQALPLKEYKVSLDTKSEIKLDDIDVLVKDFPDYRLHFNGDHMWEIMENDKILNYSYFSVIEVIYYDIVNPETGKIDDGGMETKRLEKIELYVPYYPSADKIVISSVNESIKTKVLEIDISRFVRNIKITREEKKEAEEGDGVQDAEVSSSKEYGDTKDKKIVYALVSVSVIVILALIIFIRRKYAKT